MTYTLSIDDTEFAGAMKVRTATIDITNYDSDSNGDGESVTPNDLGMNRFIFQDVGIVDNTGMTAQYDETNQAVRLYYAGTDGNAFSEVTSGNNEGAKVRFTAFGK